MAQITVTLPDGSQKHVESGTPVSAIAAGISPRLADAALAAWVDDRLVDLTITRSPRDARRAHRHQQESRGAGSCIATPRRTCWPPP